MRRTEEEITAELEKRLNNDYLHMVYDMNRDATTRRELAKIPMDVLKRVFVAGGLIGAKTFVKIISEERKTSA